MTCLQYGAILSFLLCATAATATAANPQETAQFDEASKAYREGDFSKARGILENLAAAEKKDPNLCYNLGNTYYRLGRTGLSILWYERALRRRPFDSDLRDNLAIARAGLKGEEEGFLEDILTFPAIPWLFVAATACLWIASAALILILLRKNRDESSALEKLAAFFALLWLFFAVWGSLRWWDKSKPWGVTISPNIQIRSGPGTGFAVGATAPEGLKILILGQNDDWTLVGLPKAGVKGWMQTANVEPIE